MGDPSRVAQMSRIHPVLEEATRIFGAAAQRIQVPIGGGIFDFF
jgi:hypothetical protein